ncbi:kinesin-like protein KIF14 [Anopheles gambiae]|uniref:kinesin-like protein KIF14 n=1 Tax=Anopheles gambiae TaxID=7165 RepID=UPI002AC9BFE1|nr:kinesin-like protein KIF14 [Anopheles gambiae]
MNSRIATPKHRFGSAAAASAGASSSPTKASTPRSVSRPAGSKLATCLLTKRTQLNTSSSESLPASPIRTPKSASVRPPSIGNGLEAKSKSSTSLNLNSCYTPSSQYRAPPTSSKSASKDFGTPRNVLKRAVARENLLNARTPECFSRISLDSPVGQPAGRHRSSQSKLDESHRSTKEKDKEGGAGGEISNLKVAVRIRPLSAKECIDSVANIVRVQNNELYINGGSTADNLGGVEHFFLYDHVFWSCNAEDPAYVSQSGVYSSLVHPLLDKAFEGYNTCLFAYGQTGSGKSYSMMGMDLDENYDETPNPDAGIIPRFCHELFARINALKGQVHAEVEVSYFEIYNEKIHDLLSVTPSDGVITVSTPGQGAKRAALKVREHPVWGPYVVDLSTHPVDSHTALRNWLAVGNSQRATAATGMNDKSSRSHSIFSVVLNLAEIVHSSDTDDGDHASSTASVKQTKRSKISLVDLAGSERVSQTCASGARLKEGVSINKSLLTLGKVISALADTKRSANTYIPYRDSVLTWLLRENLGGNSRTVMLATISPASIHLDETLATLRYACQARSIVNRVKVNEDPHDRIIRELRAEVERLQVLRQDYERQKRLSEANQHHHPPRKIIIETSVDDSEVEALRQQLAETEQELAKAQRSWRERLQEAEDVRRTEMKLLKRKGLALELSAEQKEPCLVNLATDPMLSGTLLYIIPPGTVKIGRPSSLSTPDIVLEGPLVAPNHCSIENRNGKLFLLPETSTEYETFVNGELVQERRQLFHGDRLVIGGSHYFRISNPLCPNKSNTQIMVDFQLAHQEILQEQENRLRRELDVEKKAAIARIEAERMAHEQEYEERLASLELEKFKYKCHKELLETEKEALLQSASKQNHKCDGRKARPSDVRDSLDLTPSAAESNLAEEIRRIMEHTSEESLAHIQMMVKEASQRCRTVGLDYEFKQTQVWQDEGIFRAMINIVDRPNGRIAEWVPARLEYWLGIVRERDDLTADNMFEHFDLVWNEPGDQSANESLLQDSHNSSRISLNLSSVIRGRNSIVSNPGSPGTATSGSTRKSQGLFKSIFSKPTTSLMPAGEDSERGFGRPASARKALFTDADSNDENVPSNNQQLPSATASQSKATVLHRFDQKAANYLKDLYGATLKLRKLCEKYQDSDAPPTTDGEESLPTGKEGRSSNAEERLASKCLESVADIERSLQTIRSVLADHNIKEATISAMEGEFGRTPKSVRFLLD